MKHKMFLTVAALVLLFWSAFKMEAQVGLSELDPNILWVADSTIGRIDGFAVHPNGNVFAYRGNIVSEINGADGKLIRQFTVPSEYNNVESIDISDDGRYLVTSYDGVVVTDLETGISKKVGGGNLVTFLPNTHKVSYRSLYKGGNHGSDSSVVILDLDTEMRTYLKTEELIHKIAFSPDGRFFATGGSLYTGTSPSYTSLKLWDAQTNKLIKELYSVKDNFMTVKIEFSPNNKSVAFFGDYNLRIFNTETYNQEKHYNDESISRFAFISTEYIGIQSQITSIVRLSDDHIKNVFEFPVRAGFMSVNITSNILYVGTGFPIYNGSIIALDLNKILSSVEHRSENPIIQASYQKGTLIISGIQETSKMVNLEIFDIGGRLVKQLDSHSINSEMKIPVSLTKGTYLLNITEGQNQYSAKFLVME